MSLTVDDYLRLPFMPPGCELRYGPGGEAFGHLYLPADAGPHPVAVVLHGGCWQAEYGLRPLSSLCATLAREGIAAWNLEFRRVGNGGGWPETFEDVAAGADFLRTFASAHGLDLARVIALGHSAGGHLALWLAARHRLPPESALASHSPLPLRGVVSLAGIADLEAGFRQKLCGDAIEALLGGSPKRIPCRYQQASPAALLPLGVPHRHIVGSEDTIVSPDHVRCFVDAAALAGDAAQLVVLARAGHFEPVVPTSLAWLAVLEAARSLVGFDERGTPPMPRTIDPQ